MQFKKKKKLRKSLVKKKKLRIYLYCKNKRTKAHLEDFNFSFGDLFFGNAAVNHIPCELIRILPIINQTKLYHRLSEIKEERPIKSGLKIT